MAFFGLRCGKKLWIHIFWASLLLVVISRDGDAFLVPSWKVFVHPRNLRMSGNLLLNPGFEDGSPGQATYWNPYGLGYTVDETWGRLGSRALKLSSLVPDEVRGAVQNIVLNQSVPRPIYFSGWSKAENVSGVVDAHYSIYLDVYYTDGTPLYGQTLRFNTGTHDWQFLEGFILPEKPIRNIRVYCLFRLTHTGGVWFDDISVQEILDEVITFDSNPVGKIVYPSPPYGGSPLTLTTGDGLSITFSSGGGAITGIALGGTSVNAPSQAYAGGFFIRDVANQSDYYHPGGTLTISGNEIFHQTVVEPLNLNFEATYTAFFDRISIHAELTDLTGADRAITLYFALPILAEGWTWGDDIRSSRIVAGTNEFINRNLWNVDIGATGYFSNYPWASLSGSSGGLALAHPSDHPRFFRLIYNPSANLFFFAYDLGLSPLTSRFPRKAWVDFILYRTDSQWGFRSAAKGYYDRFPEFFQRSLPPEQEGIWVAFSDLSPIPNIQDFGIAFHELGNLNQVAFDDSVGILSFRYIAEPWSMWWLINDPNVDPFNYDQVVAYVQNKHQTGSPWERRMAEATLSSGMFDENNRYRYIPYSPQNSPPWCRGVAGCAAFIVNPDPDITDPQYPLNKANLHWNDSARNAYRTYPGLDGEYVDSYLGYNIRMDFRVSHYSATDIPLTFRTQDWRLGLPEVFATTEFSRWLSDDVHNNLRKWTMANAMLTGWSGFMPWGVELFDFMGIEVDWQPDGTAFLRPDSDAVMNYRRTLAYQKPYGLLMNTNFDNLTYALVERYFQICLFYGIYPSMFSHNAAEDRYWDNPGLYERDRPLFRKYIPLIKRINRAGWEPIPYARADNPSVWVERFGSRSSSASGIFFTVRNSTTTPIGAALTLESQPLRLNPATVTLTELLSGQALPFQVIGGNIVAQVWVDGEATLLIEVTARESEWTIQEVDRAGNIGWQTSIGVGPVPGPGVPPPVLITYYEQVMKDLRLAVGTMGNSWRLTTLDAPFDVGRYNSIAVRDGNNFTVSYYQSGGFLKIWQGNPVIVDAQADLGAFNDIVLAPGSSLPVISYAGVYVITQLNRRAQVRIAYFDGMFWRTEVIEDAPASYGSFAFTSIAQDGAGTFHISYRGPNRRLKHAWGVPGSWVTEEVLPGNPNTANVGQTSILISSDGVVHIFYNKVGGGAELYHAYRNATGWNVELLASRMAMMTPSSAVQDLRGNFRTIAYDTQKKNLVLLSSGAPAPVTIDSEGDVGQYASIAVDSQNCLHIAYIRGDNLDDLKYATNWNPSGCFF